MHRTPWYLEDSTLGRRASELLRRHRYRKVGLKGRESASFQAFHTLPQGKTGGSLAQFGNGLV
jgi:hypothetical protein